MDYQNKTKVWDLAINFRQVNLNAVSMPEYFIKISSMSTIRNWQTGKNLSARRLRKRGEWLVILNKLN